MSESLKEMSRSGQALAKECSEPVAEKMIGNLKKVKEMFSQIHRGVSERCIFLNFYFVNRNYIIVRRYH
mgnify:FL=1